MRAGWIIRHRRFQVTLLRILFVREFLDKSNQQGLSQLDLRPEVQVTKLPYGKFVGKVVCQQPLSCGL
jgi:hypothetical protein